MAHAPQSGPDPVFSVEDHRKTYDGFIRGIWAVCLSCVIVLFSLLIFGVAARPVPFAGIFVLFFGFGAIVVDLFRSGSSFRFSMLVCAVCGFITVLCLT